MSKFFLCTFGCRCNQADSAEIRARLCEHSMLEAAAPGDADLIVVNSCTVTQRADQQVRQAVRRFHRVNNRAKIVVTGCYAQRDPEALASIPGVNQVLGNTERHRLADIWRDRTGAAEKSAPSATAPACTTGIPGARNIGGKTRPFLKIQDGCDARCAYCIVPSVRGPGRSMVPGNIVGEVRSLVAGGYQEIVLTGVHLGTYGRRLSLPTRLTELLPQLLAIPGLGRLRLSSIEPMDFDRALVGLAAANRAFARHFHIPLQSGSDRILRLMRRPYSSRHYLDLLGFIQSHLPDVGLGTDVLVGFPGETEADFEATCELVRRAPLSYVHVFPFSAREGTEAWEMPGKVAPRILRLRCEILREISRTLSFAFRRRFLGQVLPAISLAQEEAAGASAALTENYIHVRLTGPALQPNRLLEVRIDEVQSNLTLATPVQP